MWRSAAPAQREGGASPGRFKLLSVNVAPCYLDSNYTCQLSLSPHLSLSLARPLALVCLRLSASLNPRTLHFSVFDMTMRPFFPPLALYSSAASLRVSQYYLRLDSRSQFTATLILSVRSEAAALRGGRG